MSRIRVVTLNALSPQYADGPRRREAIRAELQRLDPDVVALQEVVRAEVADLVPGHHLALHPAEADDGSTAVLASRWPFVRVHRLNLDVTPRAREFRWGGAAVAELDVPGVGRVVVAHHKPCFQLGFERERELQAVATAGLVERVVADRPAHAVLLGDLDATPDAASIRFLTGRRSLEGVSVSYHDTWETAHPDEPGHTFAPANPLVAAGDMPLVRPRRIDYVLVRDTTHGPTLRVDGCELAFTGGPGGVPPSDHLGLVVDLAPPDRSPGAFGDGFVS
ncbi:endonuclease/exonuclease/phosphatase family protein [Pseudonocardia sp. RS11V-5]|uniref:endonuclease/exonuclease/phosphatase family protein n=1 Tax=Pseudonocardia terrae TaxID=2905831 RepID=UPI001E2FA38F|nr:endonuclease/exonuclease/phosphatase family protein [Pseudonocardia terrae]MCE3551989.1 endonuclease/exonuclease/phosphatase family protein [Pseudonocardia terrae]